ncbi:MAG: hypothetical protein K2N87_13420 [Eubacterium sp.]|nr:hypothetical protein [Eubacterium sp.]
MQYRQILQQIKPPCPRCPYKLGLVQMVVSPCPQCKSNRYQMFALLQNRSQGQSK